MQAQEAPRDSRKHQKNPTSLVMVLGITAAASEPHRAGGGEAEGTKRKINSCKRCSASAEEPRAPPGLPAESLAALKMFCHSPAELLVHRMSATFRKPMPSSRRCQHLPATASKSPPGLRLTTGRCQFLSRGEGATCRTGVTPGSMLDAWSRASKKTCESRLVQLRHGRLCKLESLSFTNLRPLAYQASKDQGRAEPGTPTSSALIILSFLRATGLSVREVAQMATRYHGRQRSDERAVQKQGSFAAAGTQWASWLPVLPRSQQDPGQSSLELASECMPATYSSPCQGCRRRRAS